MDKKSKPLMFLILLLTLSFLSFYAEAANKSKLKGTLYAVDNTAKTLTIKDKSNALIILNITPDARIKRNGSTATLTDLVLGDKITCDDDGLLAPHKIKAKGKQVTILQGGVQNIQNGIIQISNRFVKTDAKTLITRNGKPASLDSLTLFDNAVAHLKNGSDDARDIQCEGPEHSEVEGIISAVDLTANTVSITPEDVDEDVTVNVTDETEIEVDGEDGTIDDLQVGQTAEAKFDPATFDAFRIEVEDEVEEAEIRGVITNVDVAAATVTIQDANGVSVIVIATSSTEIERDDEPAFLSDLQIGDCGKAKYDAATFEAFEIEAESECQEGEVKGTITDVNLTDSTITLLTESGNSVTLLVTADTVIEREDEPAVLSDLQVGDSAEAEFNTETMIATFIEAEDDGDDD
ncbi:DUF5666 domain-containing protein [bacterium]|nr:DUF5666 domain-containing protein [bacterium]